MSASSERPPRAAAPATAVARVARIVRKISAILAGWEPVLPTGGKSGLRLAGVVGLACLLCSTLACAIEPPAPPAAGAPQNTADGGGAAATKDAAATGDAAGTKGVTAPAPPDRRELWVPADQLAQLLTKYPRAVLLSRAEYEALLRDAGPLAPHAAAPPREAALVSALYSSHLEGAVLSVQAELTSSVLTEEWAQLPLHLGSLSLGEALVDRESAITTAPAAAQKGKEDAVPRPSMLLLHGRGPHKITLRFTTPIRTDGASHSVSLQLPTAAASAFAVDLPPHSMAESDQPVRVETLPAGTRATVAMPQGESSVTLRWRSAGEGVVALPPAVENATAFTIDADTVHAETSLTFLAATGTLPDTVILAIPLGASVVELKGSDVLSWAIEGERATVHLQPGRGARTVIGVTLQQPALNTGTQATLALPMLTVEGAGKIDGHFTVAAGAGVSLHTIIADPAARPLPAGEGEAARWKFSGVIAGPRVTVQRLQPRFAADLDTLLDFQSEAIFLERTVTLHPEEGGLFALLITLPAGEEVLAVRGAEGTNEEPLWQIENQRLAVRWIAAAAPGKGDRVVRVRTRLEPAGWASGVGRTAAPDAQNAAAPAAETFVFPVAEAHLEGAEKISGYLALQASENFRLETQGADALEPRDGRTTPVRGAYAWFRRGDFKLNVRVTRRPSEVLATVTGYALPLAGVLDLHAEIAWDFRYSGVRSVQVRVPLAQADLFYFDGPQIAERTLAGNIWTLVFQKELTGPQTLTVAAQIPVKRAEDAAHFTTSVPLLEPLSAQRVSGTWAIEANTDTEIQLTATGMNEQDALLAPTLAGYQPRHRVIGVFSWLGPNYTLALSGVRHASASVLTTVVDELKLTSVLETSGLARTEALLTLRTAGAQFLDVTLPPASRLLSLLVDGEPAKPVEGRPGDVRIQLTARQDPAAAVALTVVYETATGSAWHARGALHLPPPQLPREVPVLKTTWRAFLPEGYRYTSTDNTLAPAVLPPERLLLMDPVKIGSQFLRAFMGRSHPIVRSKAEPPDFFAAEGGAGISKLDPDNIAARKRQEETKREDSKHSIKAYDEARSFALSPKQEAWAMPVSRSGARIDTASSEIQRKLQTIIIPKFELREATVREAFEFLEQKAVQLNVDEPDSGKRGFNLTLKLDPASAEVPAPKTPAASIPGLERAPGNAATSGVPAVNPSEARITVSLTDIPLGEALRYVTNLAGLKYKVEQDGVSIVPLSTPSEILITKEYHVPPSFRALVVSTEQTKGGITDAQLNPTAYLEAQGLSFPPGAAATYLPHSGKLIVKNTQENLDLLDASVGYSLAAPSASNPPVAGEQARQVGLLPMKLALPTAGEELVVEGFGAPAEVQVRYAEVEARAHRLWLLFFAGALIYFVMKGRHPWWRTLWAILLLTAIPLCLSPTTTATCNVLLLGWLAGLALERLARRFIFAPSQVQADEVMHHPAEVAL